MKFYGVPVDTNDDAVKLQTYITRDQPAYTLLAEMELDHVDALRTTVQTALENEGLPASVVT